MLRAPILAAFFVLSALTLAGLASRPVHAAQARQVAFAEPASADGCPYSGEGGALPEGHPPIVEHRLPAGHPPVPGYEVEEGAALPPGHPPVGRAVPAAPPPRFDRTQVVEI